MRKQYLKYISGLTIKAKILLLFSILILVSISIVGITTYKIAERQITATIEQDLTTSTRIMINQISLLEGAYTSSELGAKLQYVIQSEKTDYTKRGLKPQIYIFDKNTNTINWQDGSLSIKKDTYIPKNIINEFFKEKSGLKHIRLNNENVIISFRYIVEKDWLYVMVVSRDAYIAPILRIRDITIFTGIVSLLLAFILSLIGARGITMPLLKLEKIAKIASTGDLTVVADLTGNGPEIDSLATGTNKMIQNLKDIISKMRNIIDGLNGYGSEFRDVSQNSINKIKEIFNTIKEVSAGSETQRTVVDDASGNIIAIGSLTDEMISNVDETVNSSDRMNESAMMGIQAVKDVTTNMEAIDLSIKNTSDMLNRLVQNSNKITEIIDLIKNISSQTHLLSLNAAIEAARAGEYGRGFSVVAEEIRKLSINSEIAIEQVSGILNLISDEILDADNKIKKDMEIVSCGKIIVQKMKDSFKDIYDSILETRKNIINLKSNINTVKEYLNKITDETMVIKEISFSFNNMAKDAEKSIEAEYDMIDNLEVSAVGLLDYASMLTDVVSRFKV